MQGLKVTRIITICDRRRRSFLIWFVFIASAWKSCWALAFPIRSIPWSYQSSSGFLEEARDPSVTICLQESIASRPMQDCDRSVALPDIWCIRVTHFFPMQSWGPTPNGFATARSSVENSGGQSFNHRSGKNSSGRWKLRDDLFAAHKFIVRQTFAGISCPTTTAGSWVRRNNESGAGGNKRSASCNTAFKYSWPLRFERVRSELEANSERIILVSFCMRSGFLHRR